MAYRRRKRLWIFKLVRRDTRGVRQIATNIKLFLPATSTLNLVALIGYPSESYDVYINHGPRSNVGGWICCFTIPMIFGGWIMTWGGLQAYILTPKSTGGRILTPLVISICFVGIGVLVLPAYVAVVIYQAILANRNWTQFLYSMDALGVLEAGWTGGASLAVANLPRVSQFNQGLCDVQTTCAASFGFLTGIALLIVFVNIGSLALLFTVRHEIFTQVGHLGQHLWTNAFEDAELLPDEKTSQRASEFERHRHPRTAPDLETVGTPTRAQIRSLAVKDASSAETESARQILALRNVERDLLVISRAVSQLTIAGAGISLVVAVYTARYEYFSLPWPM